MNQIIYDISKNIKRVFNKVDINLYIVGSYANNTQREDSDINVHLFSEDYDLDKQTKLIQLFRMSLDQKINKKLKISTYDIKSLTTDKPSLSQIEHYCRLYNGSYVAHNDFGLDPSKIRTPDQNLTDLCNQINLAAQWLKIEKYLSTKKISFEEYGVSFPADFIKIIMNSIFITKSSSYELPHTFIELMNHTEKYSIGIKELSERLLSDPSIENVKELYQQFKSLYITSIIKEYGRDNFPGKDILEKYETIHSSDRKILYYYYPELERVDELETKVVNFYDLTKKYFHDDLDKLESFFKTL